MKTLPWILCAILLLVPAGLAEDGQPEDPAGTGEAPDGETSTETGTETESETDTGTAGEDPGGEGSESETGTEGPEDPEDAEAGDGSHSDGSDREEKDEEDEFEDDEDGFRSRTPDDETLDFAAPEARAILSRPGVGRLETQVDALLEFRDEDGNGAYDLGEPVLQRLALRDLPVRIDNSTPGVRDVLYDLGTGTLVLRFHASTGGTSKFDVLLDDFPFTAPDGRVAVASRVDVEGGVRMVEVGGHPAVAGQRGQDVAYLSWVPTVETEAGTVPVAWSVHVSVSSDRESAIVYWAYPHAARIIHDPVLGITSIPLERLGDPLVFGVALAGTTMLLLGGFEVRRRFRP